MKTVIFHILVFVFGGIVSSNAKALTLEDALAAACHNSPILKAHRAELRAIDERMAQAVSGWRPTITGETSYQERHQDAGIGGANSPINPDVQYNPFKWGVTLEQPIYRGGQTVAEMRQAKSEAYEGRANLRAREQDVLLNTVTAYFDVRQDQVVQGLNRNNVQVLSQQLEASRDRFEVGEITRTDVAQAEAALSAAVSSLTLAEARLTGSRARYQRYVGLLPGKLEAGTGLPPLPANVEDAIAIAIERNPFLVAARHGEEAARHIVQRSVGNMLPVVSVQGEFSRTKEPSQFREYSRTREVMARLSVPLYQAGGASSRVRQARQTHNQRRIETLRVDREVRKRLKDVWAEYLAVKSTIISHKEQVRANEMALEGVRQEAMVGSRTTLDILEEEQRLLDSRVALENANRDEYVTAYEILSLIGDFAPEKLSLTVQEYDPTENYRKVRYSWFGLGRSANTDPLPSVDTSPVATSADSEKEEIGEFQDGDTKRSKLVASESPEDHSQLNISSPDVALAEFEDRSKYLVQIAAYRSVQKADQGWAILADKYPDILGMRSPNVIGVMLKGEQPYYRLRVGPKAPKTESQSLCDTLKDQGQDCWLVRH